MLKIGLTGNIGSGKSTVAKIFCALNIPVFNSDEVAKKSYSTPEIRQKVIEICGDEVIENELISFKKLAHIIFNDEQKLREVIEVVHPFVKKEFFKWCEEQSAPYVIFENAVLFEYGFDEICDKVILVTADLKERMERIVKRDKTTINEIQKRMKFQIDQQVLISKADFIIKNNNNDAVIPQVLKCHEYIMKSLL